MAYTLRIQFSGLCLFVPEPAANGNPDRMHVLLPVHGHDDHHRHLSVLSFDTAHLTATSQGPHRILAQVRLREKFLGLSGAGVESLALCPEIVDLRPVTQEPVDPQHLGPTPGLALASRVTLAAGKMTRVGPGVCWTWGAQVRRLANRVEWTIRVDAEPPLVLSLAGFPGKPDQDLPPLFPLRGISEDVINLAVHHVPPGDLPLEPGKSVEPPPDTQPPHFAAFYELFESPAAVRLPRFASTEGPCHPDDAAPCERMGTKGGSPYTCMVAGSLPPG